jgi:hypothetical protein
MRVRSFVILKGPTRKDNQDTSPVATLYYEVASNEPGARLSLLVEDGGVGVAALSLGLDLTT